MSKQLLTPSDVMKICKLSRTATYDLFHSKGFPLIILSKNILRVDSHDFQQYLDSRKTNI